VMLRDTKAVRHEPPFFIDAASSACKHHG